MFKQAVREAVFILLIAVVLAVVVHAVRPDKSPPVPSPGSESAGQPAAPPDGFAEIGLTRAKQLFDADGAIFADARHPIDFAAGHIRGARNLVAADPEQWLPDLLASTDPAQVIVTYCDGEQCHLAPELAELLFFNGFDNVFYLKNGWTRWREHGFPTAQAAD